MRPPRPIRWLAGLTALALLLEGTPASALRPAGLEESGAKGEFVGSVTTGSAVSPTTPHPNLSAPLTPPWPPGTGRVKGVEEFAQYGVPEDVLKILRHPKSTFTQRAIALIDHLQIPRYQFGPIVGANESLVQKWIAGRIEAPRSRRIPLVSHALHADPFVLLAGLPEARALRTGPINARLRLALEAGGFRVPQHVAEWESSKRDTIFSVARLTERHPAQLETGFVPTHHLYVPSSGSLRAFRHRLSELETRIVPRFHKALLSAWRAAGVPDATVAEWGRQIAADPTHRYPGLVGRLLGATPQARQIAVYYGLLSEGVSAWLAAAPRPGPRQRWQDISEEAHAAWLRDGIEQGRVRQLAEQLATAHRELEEMFAVERAAASSPDHLTWCPPWPIASGRLEHTWDLVARLFNRARWLAVLDTSDASRELIQNQIGRGGFPELMIITRAHMVKELTRRFRDLPGPLVRSVVWNAPTRAQAVLEGVRVLTSYAARRWIYRVGAFTMSPRAPLRGLHHLALDLDALESAVLSLRQRQQALQTTLASGVAERAIGLARGLVPIVNPRPSDGTVTLEIWPALDLLHRVIAWRQLDDPGFLPHPVDVQDLEPVVAHVTKVLVEAHGTDTWPQTAEALDGFLHDIARSLPPPLTATGLEERVAPSDEAARLLWQA